VNQKKENIATVLIGPEPSQDSPMKLAKARALALPKQLDFVMLREQTTDPASLAEYGPRASLAVQGHPSKLLAAYGAIEQAQGSA
jgi:hypothetical protein